MIHTKVAVTIACAAAVLAAAGCATKRYPMATPVSPAEAALMDCGDIELELIRAEEVRRQISETARIDWRSGAAFLNDFGIGNAMAKSEAEYAVEQRIAGLRNARARRDCGGSRHGEGEPTAADYERYSPYARHGGGR